MKIYAMRKYCLTYDAKNSKESYDAESSQKKKTENENLKKRIAKILIDGGAINLESYVASTITFFDDTDTLRINHWKNVLLKIDNEIYYYLCAVTKLTTGKFVEVNDKGDVKLNQRFQELIKDLI